MQSNHTPLPQPPFPWLEDPWQRFVALHERSRLAHALLLVGPRGVGALEMGRAMAEYLLCAAPQLGRSCGSCKTCLLLRAGNHPDLHWLTPDDKAAVIKVDQVRAVTELAGQTAQQGGRKLVVIHPAEALNVNAANALLKSLEEPSGACFFILVCENPNLLMATIRSRCSRIVLPPVAHQQAVAWLQRNQVSDAEHLLPATGGQPLTVMRWLEDDLFAQKHKLEQALLQLLEGQQSPVDAARALGTMSLSWTLEQLMSVLIGGCTGAFRNAGPPPGDSELMARLVAMPNACLMRLYDTVILRKQQLLSGANPNAELLLNELLIDFGI